MKKITYLLAITVLTASFISCDKEMNNEELDNIMLKASVIQTASTPVSLNGTVPVIISGTNKGGNRTCTEVASAFNTSFALCGEKLDYGDFDFDGDFEFSGNFPNDLNVRVDGIYVSFDINNCLLLNGQFYKVGAVIVKGANSANIYFYPEGCKSDSGLAAPGDKYMVSNLTFCFVRCDVPDDLVIAVKTMYSDSEGIHHAVSTGNLINQTWGWCFDVNWGYNPYPSVSSINLVKGYSADIVGHASITNGDVTVTLNQGMLLLETFVFVGTLSDLRNNNLDEYNCPDYENEEGPWIYNKIPGTIHFFDL